ncbi:MAG: hypothetical protein FJ284_06635 [Planctomycetes bacterium]|nr:hypothetical protein [Planctomycetota bacterium]
MPEPTALVLCGMGAAVIVATARRRRSKTEVMRGKTDESPGIKSKTDDVAEAVAALKRDLIEELPKMRRDGRTDVSDLTVSVNSLTPVSEPLYAVA